MTAISKYSLIALLVALAVVSASFVWSRYNGDNRGSGFQAAPIGNEDSSLSVVYERFSVRPFQPPENNLLDRMIEQDLHIKLAVQVRTGSYGNWLQQFNARVARNMLPDLVMLQRADLLKFAQNGTIIPLNEWLANVPELQAREINWMFSTINNDIYGIPKFNPSGPYTVLYIRKDWLDRLQLPMPATTEELVQVLRAFTFQDPDGNGKDDTYGFSAENANVVTLSALTNAFGLPQYGSTKDGIPEDWIDAQGKLHFGPISDEYKHYLQYMNQLYEAKVLDPDLVSNSATIFQQKMVQGQVGVVAMFSPQQNMFEGRAWNESLKKADPNAEWVYLSPVKGPNGYYGNNANAQSSVFSIAMTKNVLKEPGKAKKVMELLAYMYNDGYAGGKGGRFIDFGAEGIHHLTGGGRIKQLLPQLSNDQNNYLLAYSMGGVLNHRDVTKLQATESEYELSEKIDADKSKNNRIVNYFYDSLPFEYNGDNYIKDASMKFIYGKEEFSEWEDYVRTLNEQYQYAQVQQIRLKELKQKGLLK